MAPPVIRHTIHCVEEAEALLRATGLAIELLQLSGGALEGDLLVLRLEALVLLRLRLSKPVHAAGSKPRGHQIVTLPLDPNDRGPFLRAHGHVLPRTCLFGLDPRSEIHVTSGTSSNLALVLLSCHHFRTWVERLGGPVLDDRDLAVNWMPLDQGRHEGLRRHLQGLFHLAEARPSVLTLPGGTRLASEDLVPLLAEALTHGAGRQHHLRRPPARIELVKLTQHWMVENPHQPITLDGLCRQVHAGRRSLIHGFREHLGMGPMAFLKLRRLHGVRRQLLAADPGEIRIQDLAMEWGFFNPGHFAGDYRQLFGELPSVTVKRTAPLR
ncbi:MAG: helix-turn-helix domain-containing protein [Cyanobium sp. Prado107]|nr:helix-turn-helix domain-containing protein [Cyanobium sp. Prado107]